MLFSSCDAQGMGVRLLFNCGARAARCGGFPCWGAQDLGHAGSIVTVHELSCSVARGIFQDHGLNLCPLYWQVDS